jgi:hypothetical protein
MKKLFMILFVAMATLTATSCGKLDQRDDYVGDYSLKIHGEFAFENGQGRTLDLDNLELHIAKASEKFRLDITGFYTCKATVVGEVITLDDIRITNNNGGLSSDFVVRGANGLFVDNTLTFVNEMTGTIDGMGFDGWLSNEAVKK